MPKRKNDVTNENVTKKTGTKKNQAKGCADIRTVFALVNAKLAQRMADSVTHVSPQRDCVTPSNSPDVTPQHGSTVLLVSRTRQSNQWQEFSKIATTLPFDE